jgi:hypothetical protein
MRHMGALSNLADPRIKKPWMNIHRKPATIKTGAEPSAPRLVAAPMEARTK